MSTKKQKTSCRHTPLACLSGQVQYVSPDTASIKQFTTEVCEVLVKNGRNEFELKNVQWSITNFLKLVAELTAKQMNKGQVNIRG